MVDEDIQHLLKVEVEFEVADGFEPEIAFPVKKPKNKPQPRKHGRSNPRSQDGRGRDERPKQRAAKSSDRYDSRKNSERSKPAKIKSGKALILIKIELSVMVSASNEHNGETIPHHEGTQGQKLPGTITVSGQGNQTRRQKIELRKFTGWIFSSQT